MLFRRKDESLISAWMPIIETLEGRQFFSADTIQSLPYVLDFSSDKGEVVDKDGQGTGFTRVQANKNGNQYRPELIDLDTTAGVLRLTTDPNSTSTAGSNSNGDNTQVNALETQFNATTSGFKITARLKGPLDYLNTASEQGGVYFGPDQDNWVKLVAISQNGGQYVQFYDEQTTGTTYTHANNQLTGIGSFATISTLDLQLVGDAGAGTVTPYYSVNGGAFVKINKILTLTGAKKAAFFNTTGRAGIIALHKNDQGPITVEFDSFTIEAGVPVASRPSVTASRPAHGDIGVSRDTFVAADVNLPTPGAGVDASTLNSTTVKLYRTADRAEVGAVLNTSGGGDAIVLTPTGLLDPNTTYTFEVTTSLKDTAGAAFQAYTATFTTGTTGGETDPSLAFEKITLPTAVGQTYTAVKVGPDGKLYAGTIDGLIQRFNINADGTLGSPFDITSLQTKEGGPRLLIGMAFDSSGNLWVSHSQYTDITTNSADDWTGKISKLSGANLQTVTTAVINLPRSVRDHLTNQLAFGPDGALYFNQGSNTAMGAPDNAWGLRSEHLLNAAILRLDITKVGASPIDVKTDSGGTYNPFAVGAPLTIYATGVRNAYDLVWTSDGKLFAAANGSAAGGSTPGTPAGSYSFGANQRIDFATNGAYTGPNVPALSGVQQTQSDYLFNIVQGGYYGHPNPTRGEFVLNGGNPTAGIDPNEVLAYPVGTMPDRNYRGNNTGVLANSKGSAFSIGLNYSPNGIIEYQGTAFGGALNGRLLVAEYSGGDDIAVLTHDVNGNITNVQRGIAGLTHFTDPLDLALNPSTGFLYVAEFSGQKLTLVRPITPGGNVSTDKSQLAFNDQTAAGSSAAQKITITNTGTAALAFPADGLSITGTDAARFTITQKPTLPLSIAPGESITVSVTFTATTVDDIRTANLQIKTNDPDSPIVNIPLRGLGTSGTGGANEPSLQQLMNLLRIPITVGDSNVNETNLNDPPVTPNDEIEMPLLMKEGNGPVTIEVLAAFGVGDSTIPTFRFGTYTPGNKNDLNELLNVVGVANSQTVAPTFNGVTSFDPGTNAFGLYTYWQKFTATGSPTLYSEDRLNQSYDSHSPRKLRFYALRTPDGSVVPNAYVFAWEEYNNGYDNQDMVGIIRNVKPAALGAEIGFENLDQVPYSDYLVFNRIQDANNSDEDPPRADNIVHDVSTLRIRNSGTSVLDVTSFVLSSLTDWQLVNAPVGTLSLNPGQSFDLQVKFIGNPGGNTARQVSGVLTINSNDTDEPAAAITLAGWWQPRNEDNKEPLLQPLINLFGWTSQTAYQGQTFVRNGSIARSGDEILSPYWKRADGTLPVTVRQLAAYHTQGNVATAKWHVKGSNTTTNLFTHDSDEGQSILPHKDNGGFESINAANLALASFTPTGSGIFGFRIDNEWTDPTKNAAVPGNSSDQGHHVRFYVVKDRNGNIIPNTYIMTMDYSGINYDYQDNTYLVTNVKPESAPAAPAGLVASATGAGIALNWNDNAEPNIVGYNVYRAPNGSTSFVKVNQSLLSTSDFVDVNAPLGSAVDYYVTVVDNVGNESAAGSKATATRTNDNTPPAAPSSLVATGSPSGIQLDWANNVEADLAGYNVYRSDSFGGTYIKINASLLSSSDFFDSTAPSGVLSYYHVSAIDTSGNESAASSANATRTSNDQIAPAAPSGLSGVGAVSGNTIDWANNSEGDLAGYNIYRSDSQFGTYVKLNVGLLGASQFVDASAPAGAASWYRVTAVDTSNNESPASTTSAARPADTTAPVQPAGLGLTPSTSGITLDWADNSESDLLGYNVYRSDAANGTFVKLNTNVIAVSNYLDATAPEGVVSYYRVTAVDASNNESTAATGNETRPIPDTLPPAAPAGLGATAGAGGITLDWADNIEPDLAGYFVYRSASVSGPWTKLNQNAISASTFIDATAPAGTSYYRVTAVDSTPNESSPATAFATRIASYTVTNIGSPSPAGSMDTINEGSDYNLFGGGGTDIYNTSDSFTFGYQQLTGDFDMKVRLAGLSNTNSFAKAGLMARESLVANSRNAFVLATPGSNGHRFTHRSSTGGSTSSTGSGAVSYPNNWLRLVRSGNSFTGYRSTDGVNWTLVGSATVSMPQTVFFGMAAVSRNTSATTTAQFRSLSGTNNSPVDQPPATPTNLTAVGLQTGVQLDWSDNADNDLTGYNVYRSSTAGGTYTKINASLLTSSDFLDTTAPQGQTSYYRVVAVDAVAQESSTPATAFATRSNPVDNTPPAAPSGLGTIVSENGIIVSWGANAEGDLAGYNIYRSTSSNGTFVLLNTSGLLTGTSFNDTAAPVGVVSFYRVTAVDLNANESSFAAINATRPQPQLATSMKINFQPASASTVSGYDVDGGAVYGQRTNGFTYGWNVDHSDLARDRNKTTNQLVDTLIHMRAGANWSGAVPNGQYRVTVGIGDAQYATTNSIKVNGTTFWNAQALGANAFTSKSVVVTVINGKITMDNGASSDQTTRVNYIEIAPYVAPIKINFQPDTAPTVSGYDVDNGSTYGDRGNGLSYGWNTDHTDWDRDRNKNANQLLDTLVHMKTGADWSIALANGTYNVKVSVGDAQYATVNTINVNGVAYWNAQSLNANQFANKTVTVTVTNGKLTLNNGASADLTTRINYIEITPV